MPDQTVAGVAGEADEPDADRLRLRSAELRHLNESGDSAAQAIALGEPLVADHERLLGPDHPDTLVVQNNLANAYQAAGRIAEAKIGRAHV